MVTTSIGLWPARAGAHADTPRLLADVALGLRAKPGDPDLLMQRVVVVAGVVVEPAFAPELPQPATPSAPTTPSNTRFLVVLCTGGSVLPLAGIPRSAHL